MNGVLQLGIACRNGLGCLQGGDSRCVAFRSRSDESRRDNLGTGSQDVDGTMEREFQETLGFGQLGGEGIGIRVAFRADYNHSSAIFNLQTADGAVRFGAKRIGHAQ